MLKNLFRLDLHRFDGEGAAAPAPGDSQTAPAAGEQKAETPKVIYGKPAKAEGTTQPATGKETAPATEETPEARKAKFEQYIQGEGKDLFGERVQTILNQRFKDYKTLEKQNKSYDPILERLYAKYGIRSGDVDGLSRAMERDDSYFEEEATRQGLTTEQYMRFRQLEQEKSVLEREKEENERQLGAQKTYGEWMTQAAKLKETYPTFDLNTELNNPVFADLITNPNVDLKTAYQAVHFDEILPTAMQITHDKSVEATVNNIKSRNSRPAENGTTSQAGAVIKSDPSKFTDSDIDEVIRRVRNGEQITF